MSKFKVGDRVKVIKAEGIFLKVGEICSILQIIHDSVMVQSEDPSYGDGCWSIPASKLELQAAAPIISQPINGNPIGGGKRFNTDKPRLELLVPEAMEAEARVWAMGAKKYGEFNWQKGMSWLIPIAWIMRHTLAILRGEDFDKESGELHAAHIKCNASMLIYYFEHFKEGDNRDPSKRVDNEKK